MDAVFQEDVLSNKIILKSIFETIKWIVIWLSVASLALDVLNQTLMFDGGDLLDVALILILLLFQHRLQFSENSGLLEEKLGFYFLGKSILKIRHLEIKEISVESISTRQNRSFSEIDIHYVADKEKQCSYTFRCFMQLKQVSSLISQFSKEKSDDGIEPERGQGTSPHILTIDKFSSLFPQNTIFGNAEAKKRFSISLYALPLPESKRRPVYFTVLCLALLTGYIAYSTQDWKMSMAFMVLTYLSYWAARALVCSNYYVIPTSPIDEITIDDRELHLPASLFTDKKPRTVNKQDIISIDSIWNYNLKANDELIGSTMKRSHLISVAFNTSKGNTIEIPHWSVDSERLVFSLLKHHYTVSLNKTTKMVYPFKVHVSVFLLLFISMLIFESLW